jgi:hypothetical protein
MGYVASVHKNPRGHTGLGERGSRQAGSLLGDEAVNLSVRNDLYKNLSQANAQL